MASSRRPRSLIFFLFTLVLFTAPVVPILWDYFYPPNHAKWLLADAANQYDNGNVEKAQTLLRRAYELSPEISRDVNFWQQLGRIELSEDRPIADNAIWMTIIRRNEDPAERADEAATVASLMLERKMYSSGLSVLKEFLPATELRTPLQNNLIAYMRALANEDLDQALEEIHRALETSENESFLDTKAWILHLMGRNEEALQEMDRSIEMHTEKLRANAAFELVLDSMEAIQKDAEPKKPSDESGATVKFESDGETEGVGWAHRQLLEKFPWINRIGPDYQVMATLRYHRLKILQTLQQTERAKEDARWLEAFSPKSWDSLH